MHKKGFYEKAIKRPQDFICALVAIIVLSPVLLVIAILVRVKLGEPVLFKQMRPGLNEKIFALYKFRTMTNKKDKFGNLLSDEKRLTSFGKKLRATSLDELPELFNILKGDMAVIGPRPLLVEYLPLYNEVQRKRHEVRPGLSGLAQVNGRNAISWEEKFEYDIKYVENISFRVDWQIVLKTILCTLKKKDITDQSTVTMRAYTGESGWHKQKKEEVKSREVL